MKGQSTIRRRIAVLAALGFALLAFVRPARAAMMHPEAPRVANLYLRDDIADKTELLSRWDILILPYRVLDLSPASVDAIRALNPGQLLYAYIDPFMMNPSVSGGPGDLHYDFYTGIDSLWIAYNQYGDSIYVWDNIHLNATERCPTVGGLRYRDYFRQFVTERLFPLIESGTIDGVYLDELSQGGYLWWDPDFAGTFDYDLNHVADPPDSVLAWLTRSIDLLSDSLGAHLPPEGLLMGANCKPFQHALNGKLYESFPSSWEDGVQGSLNSLDLWNTVGPDFRTNIINALSQDPSSLKQYRWRFASSLLSDCYFNHDHTVWDHYQLNWYDLYDFNLGLPASRRYTFIETPALFADFEDGIPAGITDFNGMSDAQITSNPDWVLAGGQSLHVVTTNADPWPWILELALPDGYDSGHWYTVSFLYRILDCDLDESLIQMKATLSAGCNAVISGNVPVVPGSTGLYRVRFPLGYCEDYRLVVQVKGGMELVVDSLTVQDGRGGIQARNYENGIVLANDTGTQQAVSNNPAWELVDGDGQRQAYPLWESGMPIFLANQDGVVFRFKDVEICLNEFQASNASVIQDEAGDYEDWIEVYNPGPALLWMPRFQLSTSVAGGGGWALPDTLLAPGEFLLVWCDGESEEGPLHADFTLDEAGGEIALFGPIAAGSGLIDSRAYGAQSADTSEGRLTDGGLPWIRFPVPTPGGSNNSATAADEPPKAVFALMQNHPNPFNPSTRIGFSAANPGHARLEIFDLSGRRVALLLDGEVGAGPHHLDWNGIDAEGRPLPSGLYLSRLSMAGKESTQKMMLLR